MFQVEWNELNLKPTKVPLYRSGREAQRAGLAGIKRVSDEAKTAIQKITARRAQGGGILAWKSATA